MRNVLKNKFVLNKKIYQTIILSGANFLSLGIGFMIALFLPKVMGSYEYGIFTLVCAFLSFVSIFFEFGFFVSAAHLLSKSSKEKQINIIKVTLFVFFIIAVIFSSIIYISSYFIDDIFNDNISHIVSGISLLAASFLVPFVSEQVLQGTNQILKLSFYNIFSKISYIAFIIIAWKINLLSVENIVLFYSIAPLFAFLCVFSQYIKVNIDYEILKELIGVNKKFGIKNYISRVFSTSAGQLNRLMLGVYCGAVDVGLFTLVLSLTTPIYVVSKSLSTACFKGFSDYRAISYKTILFQMIAIFFTSSICFFLSYILFNYYYGEEYKNGLNIFCIVMFATIFQAIYVLYNNWLAANALGKEQLITSTGSTIISLFGNIVLAYLYGIYGVAITLLIEKMYFMIHIIYYYLKKVR